MHAPRNALILWNIAWALTFSSIQPYAQLAPEPAASPRDYYRAGIAAATRGNFTEAAELLKQLKPEHPQYAKAMALLADQIYCGALHRPQEEVAFAQKAYAAAPTDNDVVRAYIRAHVLAGVWFDDKDIARERPKTVSKQYAFLVSKPRFDDASRKFPRVKLEADLAFVEQRQTLRRHGHPARHLHGRQTPRPRWPNRQRPRRSCASVEGTRREQTQRPIESLTASNPAQKQPLRPESNRP